jgi:hypothetical protein
VADRPKGQRCKTCRFWREIEWPRPGVSTNASGEIEFVWGHCLRYPPTIYYHPGYVPEGDATEFPRIASHGWCGEWSPASPETVDEGAAVMARMVLLGDMTAARALADKLRE